MTVIIASGEVIVWRLMVRGGLYRYVRVCVGGGSLLVRSKKGRKCCLCLRRVGIIQAMMVRRGAELIRRCRGGNIDPMAS